MRYFRLSVLSLLVASGALSARPLGKFPPQELGFWIGGANPQPGTKADELLDANVGVGLFYRVKWPWILMTETGIAYTNYYSRGVEQVLIIPAYAALVYELPFPGKLQSYIKLGGGGSKLDVKPYNKTGWDPMVYGGAEFSLQAGKHLRLGMRLDYNYLYESNKKTPFENTYIQYLEWQRLTTPNTLPLDPRFQKQQQFELVDGRFFHFGIMVSFIL